ncbi:hypothetical protein [Treponema sp. C6A8]|uniref:hypothetical protein n=1 Tax=Treponema sp. C6A8 TaxID=1410609 RepID=UPI000488FB2F|nr:hypothetical protein [Treponema sp. C6A8]
MKLKKVLVCLTAFTVTLAMLNAQSLPVSTEKTQNEFTERLWTDAEVQNLVNELNALSENYIKEAYSAGWKCGYKEGYCNGQNFALQNPPSKLKARYFLFGFCGGVCIGSAGSFLVKLRL